MPTLINSGDYFDICFTSNWTTIYLQFAAKDAFLDITELLPEYAKETYDFIPEALWKAAAVDGKIFGVPSYKEMGWQSGFFVNSDMADEYGIDLSKVKTLEDYTEVLDTVHEKSTAAGKNVIGVSGLNFGLTTPFESLTGDPKLPGASPVAEYGNFQGEEEIFNQYTSQEYMDYCKLVRGWYNDGYLSKDPVNYDTDTANRDNDFKNGTLFSYVISYAPGAAESEAAKTGHGVTFVPLMNPLFETRNAMGGLRSPYVDCPLYVYTPAGGTERRLTDDEIRSLYSSREDYVKKVTASVNKMLEKRYILPEHAEMVIKEAEEAELPF